MTHTHITISNNTLQLTGHYCGQCYLRTGSSAESLHGSQRSQAPQSRPGCSPPRTLHSWSRSQGQTLKENNSREEFYSNATFEFITGISTEVTWICSTEIISDYVSFDFSIVTIVDLIIGATILRLLWFLMLFFRTRLILPSPVATFVNK